ncbi:MAG: tetratricopeptide repeat protein [bacterium]|nr:tetratricopeptide repeat protein [bacterium]
MTCPRCGAAGPDDATRCSACGIPLAARDDDGAQASDASSAPTQISDHSDAPTGLVDASESPTVGTPPAGAAAAGGARKLRPGELLGDRYAVEAVLGEGGFGAVYRAHDRVLERTVALKVIQPALASNPEMLERFKREILLASKITHKNVVRIHDLGEIDDVRFVSMAFVEGDDLKQQIEDGGPLPIERAAPMIRQMAEALQAAHDAGVIHRDLKPQNILVDGDDNAYVADFGISRSSDSGSTMTETGAVLGTLAYMSPEQAQGEVADERSDVFSLGLIVYEMLTGELPFIGHNQLSSLMKRVQEDAPTVQSQRTDVPPWMSRIVSRMLHRDVAARYQSMNEVLADLDAQHASVAWRRGLLRRAGVGAAALLALGAVIWGAWSFLSRETPEVVPQIEASLILLPFLNVTQDPGFDWSRTGLPDLLRADLQQTRTLRIVGEQRVREIVDAMQLDTADELDSTAMKRLSGLIGVETMLAGSLFRAGDRFRIDARLVRLAGTRLVDDAAFTIEGDGEDALFAMIDDLADGVRDELDLSRRRGDGKRSTTELSTDSVQALKLYTEGTSLARDGRYLEAVQPLESALAVDPEFAIARARLAETLVSLGRTEEAGGHAEQALAGLHGTSPYEEARIRAIQADLSDDAEAAAAAYAELPRIAPNSPESHYSLAMWHEQTGEFDAARGALERALELDPKSPTSRYALGRVHVKSGDTVSALDQFDRAAALHRQSGNDEGLATVLNGIGNTYRYMGNPDEARRHYEQSLGIRRRIGDTRGVSVALNNLALIHMSEGDFDEAVSLQQESIATSETLGDSVGLADANSNLGDIYVAAGRPDEAVEAYKHGLRLLREIGDEASLARTMGNLGYIYTVLGKFDEAYPFQKNALDTRRALGSPHDVMRSLVDIGYLEQVQGRYEQALDYYGEGMQLAGETQDRTQEVTLSANIASIHADQGNYASALSLLDNALEGARELGDGNLIVSCLIYSADVRRGLGRYDEARANLEQALASAQEMNSPSLTAEIRIQQGLLEMSRGERDAALQPLRQALRAAESSQDYRLKLTAALHLAEALGDATALARSADEAGGAGLKPLAAWGALARARMSLRGGSGGALQAAEEAVRVGTELRQADLLLQAHGIAAAALDRDGRADAAKKEALAALEPLEQLRRGLSPELAASLDARADISAFAALTRRLLKDDPAALARLGESPG